MGNSSRILVIKLGALGDVVLAMPHIKQIVETHTGKQVTLMTAPEYAELVKGYQSLRVVAFKRRGLLEMWRVIHWLLVQRFDVVFDLQGSVRSRIMTRVSGAVKRVGCEAGLAYTHVPPAAVTGQHAFDRLNALLQAGGLEPAEPGPWPGELAVAGKSIRDWRTRHGLLDKRLVLMHAGSSPRWPSKRWDESNFLALAGSLEERGFRVIWLGGAADRVLNQRLAQHTGIDATGVFSHSELIALGGVAEFAMVNDSGPMHLLAAATLPVYAFFGPTDWRRSHAPGQADRVLIHPVPCSPCQLPVCPPERKHRCLDGITPAQVLDKLSTDGLLPGGARR